jgi:threonine dehydratase
VQQGLVDQGFKVKDLSENEMAKVGAASLLHSLNTYLWLSQIHARHLAGGRAFVVDNEVLFRFEFPERPGALKNFLESVNDQPGSEPWNISLFHYRNQGGDIGHVLVGMQVPVEDRAELLPQFLGQLGYTNTEESTNSFYRQFLL